MLLTETGTAMMSVDRGHGQFAVEIRSDRHWWPLLLVRVGSGTRRMDAHLVMLDGTTARKFPTCYTPRPEGTDWPSNHEAATAAAKAAILKEAAKQRDMAANVMRMLLEGVDRSYKTDSPLMLALGGTSGVDRCCGVKVVDTVPERYLQNGFYRRFVDKANQAQKLGKILVAAFNEDGTSGAAYAIVDRSDMKAMSLFLEAALLFREFDKEGGRP